MKKQNMMLIVYLIILICLTENIKGQTKLLVVSGTSGDLINNNEVVDLSSTETNCKYLPLFPKRFSGMVGTLDQENRPFVCGGFNHESECHVFDEGQWKASASLLRPHNNFAMARSPYLDDGSLYLITGGGDYLSKDTAERLTPNGWVRSKSMPFLIENHCMVPFNDTSVMVIGGSSETELTGVTAQTLIFNSDTNHWTIGPKMLSPRVQHSCGQIAKDVQSQDKVIIVAGGEDRETFSQFNTVEILDIGGVSDWRSGPPLPIGISSSSLVEDPSGGVLLVGGLSDEGNVESIYKLRHAGPEAVWEEMPQKLKIPRWGHVAFFVPDEITNCTSVAFE